MANTLPLDTRGLAEVVALPMTLERITDEEALKHALMRDRYANAYLLGMLAPAYAPFCRWYGEQTPQGELNNLLLVYQGLRIPVVFLVVDPADARSFFHAARPVLPKRFQFHIIGEQLGAFCEICEVAHYQKMHRMGLQRRDYQRVEVPPHVEVARLGHRDTAAIMDLYAHYPDHFFEPYQLETGLYFGVRDPNNKLLSIAGVHYVSPEYDVAIVGNLVTHPSARGQKLATACTSRLLDALFEHVSFVALNVQYNNEPAIRMYANFGFEPNNIFFEGRCEGRSAG